MKPSSTAAPDNRLAATNAAAAAAISRPFTNKQPLPIIPRSTTTFPPPQQQQPRHSSSYSQPPPQRPRLFAPRNPNPQFIRNPNPQIQNPQNQHPQSQNQNQHQNQHLIYPVVSPGRGYRAIRPEQSLSVANRAGGGGGGTYQPRPPPVVAFHNNQTASRGFVFSNSESLNQPVHMIASPYVQRPSAGAALAPIRGIPVSSHPNKVASSLPIISNSNGYKDSRERSKEDPFVTFRDRKVRIKDGASLYALCRSWLKNGSHEESQPQNGDGTKCLPRTLPLPLPIPARDNHLSTKKEVEQYEDRENEESVENLSAEEILQRHIKRAKRVRSRLREERLQRIARYKARLATLLPPPVDQNCTDDNSA